MLDNCECMLAFCFPIASHHIM